MGYFATCPERGEVIMGYFATCPKCGKRNKPYEEGLCQRCHLLRTIEKLEQLQADNKRLRSFAEWCKSEAYDPADLIMNAINALSKE